MIMKKRIYMITFVLMLGLCTGCSKGEKEKNEQITENEIVDIIEDIDDVDDEKIDGEENEIANGVGKTDAAVEESNHREENDILEIDFTKDYSEDIKADVDDVILNAVSLQGELAKVKGESFEMPEISSKYGLFVDNQGTGSVYSYLNTKQGMEENDEAIISVYKQGEIEGSFIENKDGKLAFTADDGSVKGIIEISGWDGASFEVTETLDGSMFSVGEIVKFPFVF